MNNKRMANIELLRLVAMAMVVAFHYQIHIASDSAMMVDFSHNQLLLILLGSWGVFGSNAFFAITAYFLLKKDEVPFKRVILMVAKIAIIGTGLYLLAIRMGLAPFQFKNIVKTVFAIFTYQYWFISVWIIITLIFPLLNMIVEKLDKKYYIFLLVFLFYFFYIYACIAGFDLAGRLGGAIWIYLLIGFLEKRCDANFFKKYALLGILILMGINVVYEIAVEMGWFGLSKSYIYVLENGASPTAALGAIFLLYLFLKIKIEDKILNYIIWGGEYSVGIYLICFPAVVPRTSVYDTIMRGGYFYSSGTVKFLVAYIGTVILTCLLGVIFDWLYEKTFGMLLNKAIGKVNIALIKR